MEQSGPGGMAGAEIRLNVKTLVAESNLSFHLHRDCAELASGPVLGTKCAYSIIFELGATLESLNARPTEQVRLQLSIWRDGLPLEAAPALGWLEFTPSEPAEWE